MVGQGDELDPFAASWTGVSVRLASLGKAILIADIGLLGVAGTAVGLITGRPWLVAVVLGFAVLSLAVGWKWVERTQRAWGYTERDEDLLVRRGVAFRQVVVVPYGRMQFVDVTDGPLQRAFGVATVQLHTAAAKSDAKIPGLSPAEATRLRDRLAARGESRAAGL